MITFVTIFLGLVLGTKPVEVTPGAGVASVEFLLDGKTVASLAAPPWRASVDFGSTLEPHSLRAVARDADGREIGQAIQRVNVFHPMAEASLVMLPGTGGTGRTARLTWMSAGREKPHRVLVTMDGQDLPAQDPSAIALPPYRPADAHLLRAELEFPDSDGATAEMLFGGRQNDVVQTELTGVPVRFTGRPPKAAAMAGWFLADGLPANVVAVDESPGDIVLVRDEAALSGLAQLPTYWSADYKLARGQRLWLAWPVTRPKEHVAPGYEVFLRTPDLSRERSFSAILDRAESPDRYAKPRLADAVAMAGISASSRNNPRAVVLFLGSSRDVSALPPETVREFLASLNVPLFIWTVPGVDPENARRWNAPPPFRSRGDFVSAVRAVTRAVAAQRIVWLEGTHLPNSVRLGPKAREAVIAR